MTREELLALKIKPINKKIEKEVKAIWDGIAKPLDGMGEFELLLARIGGILESTDLNLQKKAIIAMCADNGIVAEHVSQARADVYHLLALFAVDCACYKLILRHYTSPPQRLTDSTRQRFAISTAMCCRKALLARQESLGWMSSRTVLENASMFSIVTAFPLIAASALGTRMGTGPATP